MKGSHKLDSLKGHAWDFCENVSLAFDSALVTCGLTVVSCDVIEDTLAGATIGQSAISVS